MTLVNCKDSKIKGKESLVKNEADVQTSRIPQEHVVKQNNISTEEAIKRAEKQFKNYLPKILNSHNANLDGQDTFTGDFTGDGMDDVAIYFSLYPREGGNTIVGQGLALYKNLGTDVKVIAGFEPDYLFNVIKISNGKIYIEKIEYADIDPRCCPSIRTPHILKISGNKVY